jgi:hypothetical protein
MKTLNLTNHIYVENVTKLKYLKTTVTSQNNIDEQINIW